MKSIKTCKAFLNSHSNTSYLIIDNRIVEIQNRKIIRILKKLIKQDYNKLYNGNWLYLTDYIFRKLNLKQQNSFKKSNYLCILISKRYKIFNILK